MNTTHPNESVFGEVLKGCWEDNLAESDALLLMLLVHTHKIQLHSGGVAGANGDQALLGPLTQREAAAEVAAVWGELHPEDNERCSFSYWYRQFNLQTPYEVMDDVPPPLLPKLLLLREALRRNQRVSSVVEDP